MTSNEPTPRHLIAVLSHPEEVATAFPWATSLARQWGLPLTLLHIIDPMVSRELAENAEAMAEDMLALLAAAPAAEGIALTTAVESGMPETILPEVGARQPGAIFVLAAGEYGAFARALLRRGRENVIHHLQSPFVFLPARTGPPRSIELAIAGVDGSDTAARALEVARSLLADTPIVEVTVVEPGSLPPGDYLAMTPAVDGQQLRLRGRAAVVLLAAARLRDAGLIVTGRNGRTGFFGQPVGSVVEWLSRNADRPLLVVPAEE